VKTARFLILIASAVHVAIPAAQARDFWLETPNDPPLS
jgi:hypothetical protein